MPFIIWKNCVQPNRPQITIWRMRIVFWTPKITNTHSEYTILTAFPLQQWLHEQRLNITLYVNCLSWSLASFALNLITAHKSPNELLTFEMSLIVQFKLKYGDKISVKHVSTEEYETGSTVLQLLHANSRTQRS